MEKKWEIAKQFDFCYGHRVWSQELKKGYATDLCLACRHLHGHQGKIIVYLRGDHLEKGMVTDFKHLGWLKKWLDDTLDHKFIMDLNDPLFDHEVEAPITNMMDNFTNEPFKQAGLLKHKEGCWTINPQWYADLPQAVREKYEGMVFVDFVPTSENLSQWLHKIIQDKMGKINVKVSRVQFFETPKSQANYYNSL